MFILASSAQPSAAGGPEAAPKQAAMCPVVTLSVKKISGVVVTGDDKHPLPNSRIDLVHLGDPQAVIAWVNTDQDGRFNFENVPKGKYALNVYFMSDGREVAARYWVVLKVTRSNAKIAKRSILILREIDCWSSESKVVKDQSKE